MWKLKTIQIGDLKNYSFSFFFFVQVAYVFLLIFHLNKKIKDFPK